MSVNPIPRGIISLAAWLIVLLVSSLAFEMTGLSRQVSQLRQAYLSQISQDKVAIRVEQDVFQWLRLNRSALCALKQIPISHREALSYQLIAYRTSSSGYIHALLLINWQRNKKYRHIFSHAYGMLTYKCIAKPKGYALHIAHIKWLA